MTFFFTQNGTHLEVLNKIEVQREKKMETMMLYLLE